MGGAPPPSACAAHGDPKAAWLLPASAVAREHCDVVQASAPSTAARHGDVFAAPTRSLPPAVPAAAAGTPAPAAAPAAAPVQGKTAAA